MRNSATVVLCFAAMGALAQNKPGTELTIRKASGEIAIDGQLNEPAWADADMARDFFLNYPVDTLAPRYQSEARILFDDHFLLLGITCYDDNRPDIVQSLRRDFDWETNDNISVVIDPFNDFTNGFYFMITPMGVQAEGTVSGGGATDDSFNSNWDNKWYSKVERHADRWVCEIAIPFKSIRYNLKDWNITFLRNDVKRNQISSWIATPIQYFPASIAYTGKLKWEQPATPAKTNISIIPYVSGGAAKDVENEGDTDLDANAGFDAKIALTPSVNLDLTVNPDFSQVEVDRQVINLTRFEFGFPERRQFFLENNDLFAAPGFPESRPFFSRRIGLTSDSTGSIQRVPILYGARISGKLGRDWRIGVMNMQTAKKENLGLPSQNFSVGVVQRQIFSRSNLSFVFVNKQSLGLGEYDSGKYYHRSVIRETITGSDTTRVLNDFNRVYGVDFNLYSKDNRWIGDVYYHRSADPFAEDENYSFGTFVGYSTRKVNVFAGQMSIGQNFNAELGFVPVLNVYPGYHVAFAGGEYKMYPNSRTIGVMGPETEANLVVTPDGTMTDQTLRIEYGINFLNTSRLEVGAIRTFQKLVSDFDLIDDATPLPNGSSYTWITYGVEYNSDTRKVFNYGIEINAGGFYNGDLFNVSGELNYRYQPFGSLSIRYDYNDISLPGSYGSDRFFLVGPRLDLTFTDKLFLTTFLQYNERSDN
ncbi:MAG TPA: DUF5916 domain-containing protein, partial [Chryseosolibacter sp.]|nr:DUF5916 domain-containing protein [Chryseosolibacter sp.]